MKQLIKGILLTAVLVFSCNVPAEQLVRQFEGTRTIETAEFEVQAPWLIDWRVNSEYEKSMGLAIVLLNSPAGTHAGTVVKTKYRGDGLRLIDESGRFRLKIDSVLANWTVKVIQLSREEAEAYKPKNEPAF
jgi:hypothetical protein